MFSKRVITSLVALGLFATTISSPAFAQDAQTGSTDGATTNTSTDSNTSAATDASTTGTTNTDTSATGTTNSTDSSAGVGTDTATSVGTTTTDKETKKEKPGKKSIKKDKKNKTKELVEAKKVDLVCMQTAVEKRDNAIIAALDTSYNNVKTALTSRRDALKAAWGIEDKKTRAEAIRKAWKDFQGTWKKERKALNEARKAAWKQFKKDKQACGGGGEGEGEGESEGADIKL